MVVSTSLSTAWLVFFAGASALAQPAASRPAEAPAKGEPAAALAASAAAPTLAEMLQAMSVDEQIFHQHLVTLTNPYFEGRAPGTMGNRLTADYFEWWMSKYKLEPAFPLVVNDEAAGVTVSRQNASFRQAFSAGRQPTVKKQSVVMVAGGKRTALDAGTDFAVRGTSASGKLTGEVAFVGYAIQDGNGEYNTFKEGDSLEGKVALFMRFEPLDANGRSKWTGGKGFTEKAALNTKIRNIMLRKPAALILVAPPGVDDERGSVLESTMATRQGAEQKVPLLNMSVAAADRLAKAAGTTLMELRQFADEAGGIRDLPGVTLDLDIEIAREQVMADNVGGIIRGRGALAEQFVVIGAHIDHVGYGYFGSRAGPAGVGKLHPGADDNASGAAGLLLAAKQLSEMYAKLPADANVRSVMLVGFNGEEGGLIGSRAFTRTSPVPADKTYAMLNMDMIGRLRNDKLEVSGVGSAEGFAEWLQESWNTSGLTVKTLPGGSGPSDHASFYRSGIPVLHFFTGLHAEYHMPTDLYPTINTPGSVKVVGTVVNVASRLIARAEPLVFQRATGPSIDMSTDKDDPRSSAADPNAPATSAKPADPHGAADPNAPAQGTGMGGIRVRFGIAPGDYTGDGGGVEVGEVFPNTTAAEAGLKQGDRIVKWDSTAIGSVEDWMPMLRKANPGDEVTLTVKRGSETLEIKAKLRARGGNE